MAPVNDKKEDGPKDDLQKTKAYVPTGKSRGRSTKKEEKRGAHLRGPNWEPNVSKPYVPTGKPRGRPKKKVETDEE